MNVDKELPIINVTRKNIDTIWPAITSVIKGCSFIAVDCELSGLGNRKHHREGEMDDRYKFLKAIAKSHSILALGISCFTCKSISNIEDKNSGYIKSQNYIVQTFNILTLCVNNYEIEYSAMKFLLSHGFDFNQQYSEGLLYYKGDDVKKHSEPDVLAEHSVRNLFQCIVKHGKPLVLHNGMMDLLFLYENFYACLPERHETFAADLASMFPNGIYDTKFISDKDSLLPASYLPYVFNKLLLTNRSRGKKGEWHVYLSFPSYPDNIKCVSYSPFQQILQYKPMGGIEDLCEQFMSYGWCSNGESCDKSHNVYDIAHHLTSTHNASRTWSGNRSLCSTSEVIARLRSNISQNETEGLERVNFAGPELPQFEVEYALEEDLVSTETTKQACHSAGYDSFMTAFAFASYVTILGRLDNAHATFTPKNVNMDVLINRVFLVGKSCPFLIDRSSPLSKRHCLKVQRNS